MTKLGLDAGGPQARAGGGSGAAAAEAPARLAGKSTGAEAAVPDAETAIRNFLPRLAVAALTPGLSDDRAALGFRLNLPLNDGVLLNMGSTLQLETVANKPAVYQPLLERVAEARRAETKSRLERTLEDYDDVTLRAALNLENTRFGRGVRQHFDLLGALARQFLAPLDEDEGAAWDDWLATMDRVVDAIPPERAKAKECSGATEFAEYRLDCFSEAQQREIEAALARLARAALQAEQLGAKLLEQGGYYRVVDLINNQPQLNGRLEYRSRRDVVGPNEWGGQLRLEVGLANLNGARRYCERRRRAAAAGAPGLTADCVSAYVADRNVAGSIARSDRFWFQVDLARQNRYAVQLPGDTARLALARSVQLTPGIGYGAYFGQNGDGTDRGRIDLQLQYVFEQKESKRQDRAIGTATFTQRLTDQSSALITLSYASRAEFLGTVDKKLRAHLGLSYKLIQPKK